jgi:hypothetical protein
LGLWRQPKRTANVTIAGVILDSLGKPAGSFGTGLKVKPLSIGGSFHDDSNVIYNYRHPLKPGIYQVRVAVRDDRQARSEARTVGS